MLTRRYNLIIKIKHYLLSGIDMKYKRQLSNRLSSLMQNQNSMKVWEIAIVKHNAVAVVFLEGIQNSLCKVMNWFIKENNKVYRPWNIKCSTSKNDEV